jgi:hypothetical protein
LLNLKVLLFLRILFLHFQLSIMYQLLLLQVKIVIGLEFKTNNQYKL